MNAGEASIATEARGVAQTVKDTPALIDGMRVLMVEYKQRIRADHPKVYSPDLLNSLFRHPYTRIEYVEQELGVSRPTRRNIAKRWRRRDFWTSSGSDGTIII